MDENNNGVNYGPDPISEGSTSFTGNSTNYGETSYGATSNSESFSQEPPVYQSTTVEGGQPTESTGMATGALVCGIVGLVLDCCGCGIILSLIATVLGVIAKGKNIPEDAKKRAKIGMILGIIGIVISIAVIVFYLFASFTGTVNYMN